MYKCRYEHTSAFPKYKTCLQIGSTLQKTHTHTQHQIRIRTHSKLKYNHGIAVSKIASPNKHIYTQTPHYTNKSAQSTPTNKNFSLWYMMRMILRFRVCSLSDEGVYGCGASKKSSLQVIPFWIIIYKFHHFKVVAFRLSLPLSPVPSRRILNYHHQFHHFYEISSFGFPSLSLLSAS